MMDEFELEINDDFNMGGTSFSKKLPAINIETKNFSREKASNLFSAMEAAIAEEQIKQGPNMLTPIDRQWESKGIVRKQKSTPKEPEDSSDSFEMEGDTGAFTGFVTQTKPNANVKQNLNKEQDDSDEEFEIMDKDTGKKFKKLDKNHLLAYINDPNISNDERKDYQNRLNELKNKSKTAMKQNKNNIKGTVIVENEEEDCSDDSQSEAEHKNQGKISAIYNDAVGEYNQKQKDLQRLQKEKEIEALAKLNILKVEQSKNKVISSVGKGLVSNNLASKAKSLAQNKEYDANKLLREDNKIVEEIKSVHQEIKSAHQEIKSNVSQLVLNRKQITIKGNRIGCVDFFQACKKCDLKLENVFLKGVNLNMLNQHKEEFKSSIPDKKLISQAAKIVQSVAPPALKEPVAIPHSVQEDPAQAEEHNDPMSKWLRVNEERKEEIEQKLNKNYDEEEEQSPIKLIRYLDVWMYFLTEDYSAYLDDIVRETESSGGVMSFFKKKQKLNKNLEEERDIFICLAKIKMDTSIEVHERLLTSIYLQLTGNETCARTGQHWIDVGFQNEDPYTDIRGSGILGLIQLLYFAEVYNELA
mmetsp:Transcript_41552/g.47935  ORF Transcript_41552/g.47935 Transcript_41552/m.47935 type:complete len:585 (+) Transcript_41552:3-1757(+)